MILATLCLVLSALVISLPLTRLMAYVGQRLGQMDKPGHRKIHSVPIPATGGVAIFWAIIGPLAAGLAAASWVPESWWQSWMPEAAQHLAGIRQQTPLALGLMGAAGVMHVMGLVDDRRGLGPMVKLAVQLGVAAVLSGVLGVRVLDVLGPVGAVVVTVLWLGVIINAFNFLDNMNGLSSGTGIICGSIFLAAALVNGQWFVAAVLALLVGALLGFIVWNYPKAIIFMGDGGSLVVGLIIGVCSVRITYFEPGHAAGWWAVLTPMVVLAIPLYDLTSVSLIRIMQGKSPFQGDTQHFSHRLVRKGLKPAVAVAVIWACAVATGLGGVMLQRLDGWQAGIVVGQTVVIVMVLALLERTKPSAAVTAAAQTTTDEQITRSGA
jgi:UDP-GlcNAc:undecaprenyl-phosphate GlcNAc-1-phosphate transferase